MKKRNKKDKYESNNETAPGLQYHPPHGTLIQTCGKYSPPNLYL